MSADKIVLALERKISAAVWTKENMPGVSQSVINQHNAELRSFLKILSHDAVALHNGKHICCNCNKKEDGVE